MNKAVGVTIVFVALLPTIPFRAAAQNAGAAEEPIQAGHTNAFYYQISSDRSRVAGPCV